MSKHSGPMQNEKSPALLTLIGIVVLLIAVAMLKSVNEPRGSGKLLEAELDKALTNGRPAVVFLHSLNCVACKEMISVISDVYPEFRYSVALIDVDVSAWGNENLMQRESLQSIPTLVFYDSLGNRKVFFGAMPSWQFREMLIQLVARP